jgi:hypothetical protein
MLRRAFDFVEELQPMPAELPSGPFAGRPLEDVPEECLRQFLRRVNPFDDATRFAIESELSRRHWSNKR